MDTPLKEIAGCDNSNTKGIANLVLHIIGSSELKVQPKQLFLPEQPLSIMLRLYGLVGEAKQRIWHWDNWINTEFIICIVNAARLDILSEVRLITKGRNLTGIKQLQQLIPLFRIEHRTVAIEVKESNRSHDRFLVIDNDVWVLGPSVKDAAKDKATTITQLDGSNATNLIAFYESEWKSASSIV